MATALNPMDRAVAVWRESSPESIEADLAALWREAGQAGSVSHALMSNLVVVSPCRSFPDIEEVARKHPARTILLGYTAGVQSTSPPEATRVGLLTFGEAHARYGVELISVHTVCADRSIPSIVRRLTHGDIPTTIWWTGDLSSSPPPPAIAVLGQQMIFDSVRWPDARNDLTALAGLLRQAHAPMLADLNWRRLAPLRHALVHALRADPTRDVRAARARIRHGTGDAAAGWLLAGWLMAGWREAIEGDSLTVEEDPASGGVLSVTMTAGGWSISASMAGCVVRVRAPDFRRSPCRCRTRARRTPWRRNCATSHAMSA